MPKFIKASYNEKTLTVEYIADNGDRLLRSGGTIAWRFNNPGNLRPGPKYALHIGQGKTASGPFLIFPTPEAGRAEKKGLLQRKYRNESIDSMLHIYAPPKENDTEKYIQVVCKKTGFSRSQIVGELTDDDLTRLMTAMEEYEGFHHKKDTRKEHWIRVTTVGFSDGARPLADLPIRLKRNDEEVILKTNSFGQLKPFAHHKLGESIELWVKNVEKEWIKLDSILLDSVSKALMFVCDRFEVCGSTQPHNPPAAVTPKARSFRYVVQPGDTLGKIARKFHVEASKIQKDNGIKNANRIMAGQVLTIKTADDRSAKSDGIESSTSPRTTGAARFERASSTERSKEGNGHPIAVISAEQKRAPWMQHALNEAERWAGNKEEEITKEQNYHKKVNPKGGLNTLVGNSNPWCASFVNWCLQEAGFQISHSPASSQSFINDKNFVKLEKPVYGAIVVWSNFIEATGKPDGTGHVGFLYGSNAVLGGNQSDAINFKSHSESSWHDKKKGRMLQKIRGYFVPLAYAEYAKSNIEQTTPLSDEAPKKLNTKLGLSNAGTATR